MKKLFLLLLALSSIAHAQTYYLPPGVMNVRAMIVGGTPLQGGTPQIWRDFCLAQRVGLAQTVSDLPAIATASGHAEIANAPFVTCGTSAGASAAAAAVIANPARGLAVVGLHGVMFAAGNDGFNANRSGENGDVPTLDFSGVYGVPMIHNFDNNDGFINPVVLHGLVEYGRAHGAPWTFFIHNDGNHTDNNTALTTLIFPWLAAVLDLRLPASAGTGDGTVTLNPIVESNGWLGDIKTKTIASYATYAGDKAKADWFPNQSVATIWSGYHFIPPYSIPAQPIVAPGGVIADLTILDPANNDTTSGTGWKINANFKEADQAGSLVKYFVMAPPPASVAGLDWIRPITPGKNYVAYTADPIFTFRVTADATVFIAHSDQGTPRPAWLSTYINTGEQLVVTSGNLNANAPQYTLFKKDFAANSIVSCGTNAPAPSGQMYLTIVKPLGVQTLASVSVSASDASATEGGDTGAFTITRTGATTSALTVNFTVSGTAASGADFVALGTSVSIPAGQSSAVVTVATVQDAAQETTETVLLTLAVDAAYNLGSPTAATVNVLDDDAPPLPVVTVADTLSTAAEPNTLGQFTILRTGDTTAALTVNFTMSGSATGGTDYTSLGTSAVIPAGQSNVALAVAPTDDALVEGTETVTLSIGSSATYALGVITAASVNIMDNDTSSLPVVTIVANDADAGEPSNGGAWTVTRTGSITAALAVSFTTTGTAARAVDYTLTGPSGTTLSIPAGQASRTITLNVANDTLVEGTETAICTISANAAYTLGSPSSATINITDDDTGSTQPVVTVAASSANASEPSTNGAWTLTRTGDASAALTVNFTLGGTAARTNDYTVDAPPTGTTLTFPAGAATLLVPLAVVDDTEIEATETAVLTVASGSGYSVGTPASATVNLADNDSAPGMTTVTLSSSDSTAAESAGTANTAGVIFTRSGDTTNALVLNLVIGGTAGNGVDVAAVPASISIPPGQAATTLTISPIDDALVEGAETFAVSLAPNANYIANGSVGVLINDNDNAAPITTTGVVFATHGSGANTRDVKLNVYLPATGSGPWPVLIYYPGGGWSVQSEGAIATLYTNLTALGYAVVSANYITSGFEKWPAQIRDGKAAVRWVRANAATYGFDPARIAVSGGSSGGHIADYVALSGGLKTARIGSEVVDLIGNVGGNFEQSDVVQAAAPFFGPTDLLVMDHYPTPGLADHNAANSPESGLIGAAIQTVPEKSATANPIALVRAGMPPFWITHGTVDALVDFNQSELLNAALVKAGQPVTFWPVQGGGHGPGVSDSQEVLGLMKAFLDRTLKGITTNALPVAAFSASTLSGTAPLTVNFDGSASSDADGVITKYSWSNGDDTGAAGATMTYTFTRPGIYPVTLAVRDDLGGTASATKNVVVSPAGTASATPPTIAFTGPADGFLYARTGDLLLETAVAANGGATVVSVEYFLNGEPIAWDSKPPFNTTLGRLPPGRYTATARVSDSTGAAANPVPISFRVFGETETDLAAVSLTGGFFTASYHRFADGTLSYAFERSTDLAAWTPFTPTQSILANGPQIQWMSATDPLPAGSGTKRFLRVQITGP